MDDIERLRCEFQAITQSKDAADRLIRAVTDYTQRRLWVWSETAELIKFDLLRGRSVETVMEWLSRP